MPKLDERCRSGAGFAGPPVRVPGSFPHPVESYLRISHRAEPGAEANAQSRSCSFPPCGDAPVENCLAASPIPPGFHSRDVETRAESAQRRPRPGKKRQKSSIHAVLRLGSPPNCEAVLAVTPGVISAGVCKIFRSLFSAAFPCGKGQKTWGKLPQRRKRSCGPANEAQPPRRQKRGRPRGCEPGGAGREARRGRERTNAAHHRMAQISENPEGRRNRVACAAQKPNFATLAGVSADEKPFPKTKAKMWRSPPAKTPAVASHPCGSSNPAARRPRSPAPPGIPALARGSGQPPMARRHEKPPPFHACEGLLGLPGRAEPPHYRICAGLR